jgi:hypothetical protein
VVLPSDGSRQFDQLGFTEFATQRSEQFIVHRCGRSGHGDSKTQNKLFDIGERRLALCEARHIV